MISCFTLLSVPLINKTRLMIPQAGILITFRVTVINISKIHDTLLKNCLCEYLHFKVDIYEQLSILRCYSKSKKVAKGKQSRDCGFFQGCW